MQQLIKQLESFQKSKVNWEPVKYGEKYSGEITPVVQVIKRSLCFVPLELQVKKWDKDLEGEIPDEVYKFFEINALDEDKHAVALTYLSEYFQVTKDENADYLISLWRLQDNSLAAMYALESGVFFSILPILMKHGDAFTSSTANWVTGDENCHASTGRAVMSHFGIKVSEPLARLVLDTVSWIFEPMGEAESKSQASRAVRRMVSGKDAMLAEFNIVPTYANFEQKTKKNIAYYSY